VGYFPIPAKKKLSEVTRLSKHLFAAGIEQAPKDGFHLSLYTLNSSSFTAKFPDFEADADSVTILRSVLMKPEHELFITKLVERLHTSLAQLNM